MTVKTSEVPTHPTQPVYMDGDNVLRFRHNAIVRLLLDDGPWDMNRLALIPFSDADRRQFAQLIGYSVCGYGELQYTQDEDETEYRIKQDS